MGTFVVVGYGPGISHATAVRFGREGQKVALIGRSAERLAQGVADLQAAGVEARSYQADASDPASLRTTLDDIRRDLGPVSTVLWTAFRGGDVPDVLSARAEDIEQVFDIGVRGLLTTVQVVLDDLKASTGAAILVANGALGEASTEMDGLSAMLGGDAVSLENAAKSKLVGLLAARLRDSGIYVGELTIAGSVAGTATAQPTAIQPTLIAETFWSMAQARDTTRARLTE
jgi:NAD(P)-dependent dehydrogenase (short-subunit alcohol dehydrogenase family)